MQPNTGPLLPRIFAVLPVAISVLALTLSFQGFKLTAVRSIKPVLVLTYRNDSGWHLVNIGNGPALNVLVAQGLSEGDWFKPVRVPPMAIGGDLPLHWIRHTNIRRLASSYEDIDGRRYSSITKDDLTTIGSGGPFPKWREEDIQKHWQLQGDHYQ